jgi:transposase-like protein
MLIGAESVGWQWRPGHRYAHRAQERDSTRELGAAMAARVAVMNAQQELITAREQRANIRAAAEQLGEALQELRGSNVIADALARMSRGADHDNG